MTSKRLDSIDVMRAMAIVFMVLCHFPVFLSPANGDYPWTYSFANHIVGDFAAPFFLFLAGLSQAVSSRKRAADAAGSLLHDRAVRRGGAVFCAGLLFSLGIRGPGALFEWDILPLIGISIIVLRLLRDVDGKTLGLTCLGIFAAVPFLRGHSGYLADWGGALGSVPGFAALTPGLLADPVAEYRPGGGAWTVLTGFALNGYFPVLPWILFVLTGFMVGRSVSPGPVPSYNTKLGLGGLGLSAIGIGGAWLGSSAPAEAAVSSHISTLSFYPLSSTLLLVQLGASLTVFAGLRVCFDVRERPRLEPLLAYCRGLSKYSLTVYVLHHAVIFWPMWTWGWMNGAREMYYERWVSAPAALSFAVALLAALGPTLSAWERSGGKFSLEWLLARLVEPRAAPPAETQGRTVAPSPLHRGRTLVP